MNLPILYRDTDIVVVHKPSGLMVHRSALDPWATQFAVQMVRDQIGQHVYPVHRLDRGTSGALIFALSSAAARHLTRQFEDHLVAKTYLAVVRGTPQAHVHLDYPLKEILDDKADPLADKNKSAQSAVTEFEAVATKELPVRVDKYPTSRYALVRAYPKTGRKHQIRRHLRHLGHPIIGDVTYGVGKHNRFFANTFKVRRLLLACTEVKFTQPSSGESVHVHAPLAPEFASVLHQLGWQEPHA